MRQITVAPRFQLALVSRDYSLLSMYDAAKLMQYMTDNDLDINAIYEISKRSNAASTVCDVSNEHANVLCTINVH